MSQTVSANDAKNRLGALVSSVAESNDPVIIATYGRPKAVIVSVADYEELERLRDEQRRRHALETIRAIRAKVLARNQDMTDEEREEFAIQAGREIMDAVVSSPDLRFERDERSVQHGG